MRRRGTTDESGAAMIVVIIWSAVLLMLSAVISQAVLAQVRPSDLAEKSFQAWSAAEAGIEDMRARLAADGSYWTYVANYYANPNYVNPVSKVAVGTENPALAGWVSVPGGPTTAQYTYWIDTTLAARSGKMLVAATGKAGSGPTEVTRTVEALLLKRMTTDYAYLSDSEAYPYDQPGVYGGEKPISQETAKVLCARGEGVAPKYWYQWTDWPTSPPVGLYGPAGMSSNSSTTVTNVGPHRNSSACLFGIVKSTDSWSGPIHTNDVWYFEPSILNVDPTINSGNSGQVFHGAVTSSCPGESLGSTPNGTCRDNHRWISTATLGSMQNWGTDSTYASYIANEIPNTSSENDKLWNPTYDSPLEMPSVVQLTRMQTLAMDKGCVFYGPTRIQFRVSGGLGKVYVTSPDTVTVNNAFCTAGQTITATLPYSAANATHPTVVLDYATMVASGFNGVFSVLDANDAQWPSSTPPSCVDKSSVTGGPAGSVYPFVIPTPAKETLVMVTGTVLGLPPAGTIFSGAKMDQWTAPSTTECHKGLVYMDAPIAYGGYKGQYTVASSRDIIITNDIMDSSVTNTFGYGDATWNGAAATDWGMPAASSTSQMGLVPNRYLYVYHQDGQAGGDNNAIKSTLSNLILNFAMLAPNKCLTIQEYKGNPDMAKMKIVGSIAQDNRCNIVNVNGAGYSALSIVYDDRFKVIGPPPFMAELSIEPWKTLQWSETDIRRDLIAKNDARGAVTPMTGSQAAGSTKSYDVLGHAPSGSVLQFARILSGSGAVTINNNQVRFTAPNGITITTVEWVVRTPDGRRVAQNLTISMT